MSVTLTELLRDGGFFCPHCGRFHDITLKNVITERGAVRRLPEVLAARGITRPYLLADVNTWRAAGEAAAAALTEAGIGYSCHIFAEEHPLPHEHTVGGALMHFPADADAVVGIGGGVIGDTAKILAAAAKVPYIYVATAPSMDGYASSTSAMEMDGLKVSLDTVSPETILLDTDVLTAAPRWMILSGYGDMAAKYVSLVEWRLAQIILDEFYCPAVADMMQSALDKAADNIEAVLAGDPDAAGVLAEGLIMAGLAMRCAGVSRPASGMEHYISHIRDMRSLAFGTPADLHGIQCGAAAIEVIRAYERLKNGTPDREKALAHAAAFDYDAHAAYMRENVGPGAEVMIALEAKEHKYDKSAHALRLERIIGKWEELCAVMDMLPSSAELEAFMKKIGFPAGLAELGIGAEEREILFRCGADIRDKYVLTRLMWDLGIAAEG